jgi:hypothetical protein
MPLTLLHHKLTELFQQLDAKSVPAPVEFCIGNYVFYPDGGYSDMASHPDFRKLNISQIKRLCAIAEDLLAMQKTALFQSFVRDEGIIVIDKMQGQIEYSMDIAYYSTSSRVMEIYPQITYPQKIEKQRLDSAFVTNDLIHEAAHHIDYWLNMQPKKRALHYLHSSSLLLNWLVELDLKLRPQGVSRLIVQVREEEGYSKTVLREAGYKPNVVTNILCSEFFAIACEYYYGGRPSIPSPLLEAYISYVVDFDLAIRNGFLAYKEIEKKRGSLWRWLHTDTDKLLGDRKAEFQRLIKAFDSLSDDIDKRLLTGKIEALAVKIVAETIEHVKTD